MTDQGERIAALEADMENVKESQRVFFEKLDSMKMWLVASTCSALGAFCLLILTIAFKRMGVL